MKQRKRFGTTGFVGLGLLLAMGVTGPGMAQVTSMGNFNPMPAELPETFVDGNGVEHRLTLDIQNQLARLAYTIFTSPGIESLQRVLDEMLEIGPMPWEVYRWAYLKQIPTYAVRSREDIAMMIGEDWLERYPDDPINCKLRCVLLQFCAWRESDHFKPSPDLLKRIADPIFDETKYNPYNADVIDAHVVYARALHRFYWKDLRDSKLLEQKREHLSRAKSKLEEIASAATIRDVTDDSRITESYIQHKLEEIAQRFQSNEKTMENLSRHKTQDIRMRETAALPIWRDLIE